MATGQYAAVVFLFFKAVEFENSIHDLITRLFGGKAQVKGKIKCLGKWVGDY
jgi:hypothetical protein